MYPSATKAIRVNVCQKLNSRYNKNNFLLFLEPKHNKYGIIKIYKIKIIKIAYNKFICINTLRRTLKFLDLKLWLSWI